MGLAIAYHLAQRGLDRRRRARARLPRRGRVGPQRRRRAPAVVDRDQHPADAGVGRAVPAVRASSSASTSGSARAATCSSRARAKEVARLEKNVALQNRCGVADPHARARRGARDIVPELDLDRHRRRVRTTRPTASCSRGRSCGATRARPPRIGVRIFTQTAVDAARAPTRRRLHRRTRRAARVRARRVINATGAWSPRARAAWSASSVPT